MHASFDTVNLLGLLLADIRSADAASKVQAHPLGFELARVS